MQGGSRSNFWGELIHQLRDEQGMSQRKLAYEARVNRSTLRRIEEGTARGDIDVIERLLGRLGYELEALDHDALEANRVAAEVVEADPEYRSITSMTRLLQLQYSSCS